MEFVLILLALFAAGWGFNVLLREIRHKEVSVTLRLIVESNELGEFGLPKEQIALRKDTQFPTTPLPGMDIDVPEVAHPVRVIGTTIADGGILVRCASAKFPQAEVRSRAEALIGNKWYECI